MRRRNRRDSLRELSVIAFGLLSLLAVYLWARCGDEWSCVVDNVLNVGYQVLPQLGWVFGIYATVLIAVYVAALGLQRSNAESGLASWRKIGLFSEFFAAALVPAIAAAVLALISDPTQRALLLVVVPISLALLVLSLELGGLVTLNTVQQVEIWKRTSKQAREIMPRLQERTKLPWLLVVFANAAVTALGGWLIAVSITRPAARPAYELAILGGNLMSGFWVMFTASFALAASYTSLTNRGRILWAASVVVAPVLLFLFGASFIDVNPIRLFAAVAMMGTAGISLVLILVGSRMLGDCGGDWSIGSAALLQAARSIARLYLRATQELYLEEKANQTRHGERAQREEAHRA